jgi:hypothetical protein
VKIQKYNFRAELLLEEAPSRPLFFAPACFGGGSSSSKTDASQPVASSTGDASPATAATGDALVTNSTGSVLKTGNLSNSQINLTDGGAIPAIAQIAQSVITAGSQQTSELFEQLQGSLDQNSQVVAANNALTNAALANNQDLAANAATGGASTASATIIKILGGFAALIFGALLIWAFSKNKK